MRRCVLRTLCRQVGQRDAQWKIVHREVAREWSRADAFGMGIFPVPPSEKDTFVTPAPRPQ